MSLRDEVDFDVVVVGAGIAGCVAAYRLAAAGHSVMLAERGAEPGQKNLSGGVFYGRVMDQVFPGFVDRAPVERRITRNALTFLNDGSSVTIDYRDARLAEPVNAVTVLRAALDPWLATQCEEAGVTLLPGVRVDGLVRGPAPDAPPAPPPIPPSGQPTGMFPERLARWRPGRRPPGAQQPAPPVAPVLGIRAGEDEVTAHVVILADGVNSFLAKEAGLRPADPTEHLAVGVKSVIALPRETIEERFHLDGDEGAAYAVVGDCTRGAAGGGFLYTNLSSISVGIVVRLDDLVRRQLASADLHDHFLTHPVIAPYLRGGELLEYGCHLVAEGGRAMMRGLVAPGCLIAGEAAGLALNTGFTVRGMDLAAGSAIAAADTVAAALQSGDVSAAALAAYERRLDESFVGADMTTYAHAPGFLETQRVYGDYGRLMADVLHGVYNLDTTPRSHLTSTALRAFRRSGISTPHAVRDVVAAARAL